MSNKNLFWLCMIFLCLILLMSCASAKPNPTLQPTPVPEDSTEAALEVVMGALEPIIVSVAAQIDQGTVALAENTKSVHKSTEPTARDTMIEALVICSIPISLALLTIAIFLFRDRRVARSVALFAGTWYHGKMEAAKKNRIVNSRPAPVSEAPAKRARSDDLNIG